MIFGKGLNDLTCMAEGYTTWHSMLRRCYSSVYQKDKPTYKGCEVSKEWLLFSNFNAWYKENYVEDWHLDKDLVGTGSLYSAENCVFLPNIINSAIEYKFNNGLPSGVSHKTANSNYVAQLSIGHKGKRKTQHLCSSSDPMVCFAVYKQAKEKYIKELADLHKEKLHPKAYKALYNFEVI